MIPNTRELRTYGNRDTGEVHYLIGGVEVTKEEYYLAWKENQELYAK